MKFAVFRFHQFVLVLPVRLRRARLLRLKGSLDIRWQGSCCPIIFTCFSDEMLSCPHTLIISYFLKSVSSPDWCGSVGHHPAKRRVTCSVSGLGTCLGCGFVLGLCMYERQLINVSHIDASLSSSLPSRLSEKLKNILKNYWDIVYINNHTYLKCATWWDLTKHTPMKLPP